MRVVVICFSILGCLGLVLPTTTDENQEYEKCLNDTTGSRVLSRRKRYIVFPKGSSLQLAIEFLPFVPDARYEIDVGSTIGLAWQLPTEARYYLENKFGQKLRTKREKPIANRQNLFKVIARIFQYPVFKLGITAGLAWMLPDNPDIILSKKKHQRFKRNVYEKIESYLNAHDLNGKVCILRALCDSGKRTSSKKSFIQEVLHRIFSPGDDLGPEDSQYIKAHSAVNSNCSTLYPDCPFTIFDFNKQLIQRFI